MRKMFSEKQIEKMIPGKVQEEIDNGNIITMPIGELQDLTISFNAWGDNTYLNANTTAKGSIFNLDMITYNFYLGEDIEFVGGSDLQGSNQDSELYFSFSIEGLDQDNSFPYIYSQILENVEVYYSTDVSPQWEKFDNFVIDTGYNITIADPSFEEATEIYFKGVIKKGYYKALTT